MGKLAWNETKFISQFYTLNTQVNVAYIQFDGMMIEQRFEFSV